MFASEATQRYAAALENEDPTDETVDAVIFGGAGGGLSDELLADVNSRCGSDL